TAQGTDTSNLGHIYYRTQTSPSSSSWTSWAALPTRSGFSMTGDPAVGLVRGSSYPFVFATNADGTMCYSYHDPSTGWTLWTALHPLVVGQASQHPDEAPVVVENAASGVSLFVHATDGHVYRNDSTANLSWTAEWVRM